MSVRLSRRSSAMPLAASGWPLYATDVLKGAKVDVIQCFFFFLIFFSCQGLYRVGICLFIRSSRPHPSEPGQKKKININNHRSLRSINQRHTFLNIKEIGKEQESKRKTPFPPDPRLLFNLHARYPPFLQKCKRAK